MVGEVRGERGSGPCSRPTGRRRGECRALTYRDHPEEHFESTNFISKAIFLRLSRLRQLLPPSPDRKMFGFFCLLVFLGFVWLVFNSFLCFLCRKMKETKGKCGGKEDAGGQLFSKITRLESVFRSGTGAQGDWALLLNPKYTVKTGVSAQSKGRTRAGPEEKPSYWKRCS